MGNCECLIGTVLLLVLLGGFSYAISPEYAKANNLTEKTITPKMPKFMPLTSPTEPKCYDFIGPKVKDSLNILVNPTNYSGLNSLAVENATKNVMNTWEIYTTKIFGAAMMDPNSTIDTSGDNSFIYFNKNSELGEYIPAQATYYNFGDKMIGANIEFNAKDFDWGDYLQNQDKIDFQGILTHELGHAIGLADVWAPGCESNTMFGMAQSNKGSYDLRTLESGDKLGLFILYSEFGKYKKIPLINPKFLKYYKYFD